jgi:alkanesulfonate monooxygenase SsuD/methylene tetrahydromethanopterin reductase-like flavin-dependent oxidoreductase (luciferase family)
MPYVCDWLAEFGLFDAQPMPRTLEELIHGGAMLLGTPDDVGERAARLIDDYGVDHLVFVACAGAVDHGRMLETIVQFGDEVIGHLSRA